jgi:hypothetical protein
MFTQEASNIYLVENSKSWLKRLGEVWIKVKNSRLKFIDTKMSATNMGTKEMDFYRIQGMSVTFLNVLVKSEDHKLIFVLYNEFMGELESSRLNDTLLFPFIKNYAEAQAIDMMMLANKLALVLKENDSNPFWFTEQLVKLKQLK